jgi:hypothetical protein
MDQIDQSAKTQPSGRGDLVSTGLAAVLVVAAVLVPVLGGPDLRERIYAASAPIFGHWLPHYGWGTAPALALALGAALWGPTLAQRLPWGRLLLVAWLASLWWMVSLAMVDGWQRGWTSRLTDQNEYLWEVPGITDIPAMLRGFADRILDFQPDSWTTHVSGHPPGAVLTFVLLDRVGLSGGGWAGAFCVAAASTVALAVLVATRALAGENAARAAAPFLVLAPLAIWTAVSADGYFAAVAAWGIALLALAARRSGRSAAALAVGAGALLGFGIYVNYGLVLMGLPAVAVLIAARTIRPLLPAVLGALAVAAVFTASGFWWFEGLDLVVERYYQGVAADRPFSYWGWANVAAAVCAVGLASAAGLHRALRPARLRAREGVSWLVLGALAAIALADLSALSKAETERIWLPFTVWVLLAASLLPRAHHRWWLLVQGGAALLINHVLLTNW